MPTNMPYAGGMFYVSRFMAIEPEQSKYTTQLQCQPDDPTRVPETYVFLPSLRRSLRLSSAARCSPILGTDWVQDDNAWNPPYFKVNFLGEKKILMNRAALEAVPPLLLPRPRRQSLCSMPPNSRRVR